MTFLDEKRKEKKRGKKEGREEGKEDNWKEGVNLIKSAGKSGMLLKEKMKKHTSSLAYPGSLAYLNYLSSALQWLQNGYEFLVVFFWPVMILNPPCQIVLSSLTSSGSQTEAGRATMVFPFALLIPLAHPSAHTQQERLISFPFSKPLWRYFSSTALNCSDLEQFSLSASFYFSAIRPISKTIRTKANPSQF